MNINNLAYKNNLNYKETVIARSIENTTKHEAEPKCACTISVACCSAKCQLSEAKAKQSREVNTLTPNPRPLSLMFTTLNSHFAERPANKPKQALFVSALCFGGEEECTPVKNSNISVNPPVSKADIPPYKWGQNDFSCGTRLLRHIFNTPRNDRYPFTSLLRYACNDGFIFTKMRQKAAFSLIELSIVLIIIGLLIAGITGGSSLIQSAKVRSLINEIKDYERAVYTFQAAKGRYPGDVKNYGTFGYYSNYYEPTSTSSNYARPGYAYKASDFPSEFITEFQKTAGSGVVPDAYSAPFVELYNEGIIDFKPLGNIKTVDKNNTKKGVPSLKTEPNAYVYFFHTGTSSSFIGKPCTNGAENCFFNNGIAYVGQIKEAFISSYQNYSATEGFDPKFLKVIDKKMDDGRYNTGAFRSRCYGNNTEGYNSYDNALNGGKKCRVFNYVL